MGGEPLGDRGLGGKGGEPVWFRGGLGTGDFSWGDIGNMGRLWVLDLIYNWAKIFQCWGGDPEIWGGPPSARCFGAPKRNGAWSGAQASKILPYLANLGSKVAIQTSEGILQHLRVFLIIISNFEKLDCLSVKKLNFQWNFCAFGIKILILNNFQTFGGQVERGEGARPILYHRLSTALLRMILPPGRKKNVLKCPPTRSFSSDHAVILYTDWKYRQLSNDINILKIGQTLLLLELRTSVFRPGGIL